MDGEQMKDMVEIEVVLDERYTDPFVTIRTKSNTQQVENIICAIEDASHSDFPQIAAVKDDVVEFVSQKDIVRVHTEGRKIVVQTEKDVFTVKRTLAGIEDVLNPTRFSRAWILIWQERSELSLTAVSNHGHQEAVSNRSRSF